MLSEADLSAPLFIRLSTLPQLWSLFWNSRKLLDWVENDRVWILGTRREKSVFRVGFDFLVRDGAEHANGGQTENGDSDCLIQRETRKKPVQDSTLWSNQR